MLTVIQLICEHLTHIWLLTLMFIWMMLPLEMVACLLLLEATTGEKLPNELEQVKTICGNCAVGCGFVATVLRNTDRG